jgi:predicted alpha/beta-fold hydrolase
MARGAGRLYGLAMTALAAGLLAFAALAPGARGPAAVAAVVLLVTHYLVTAARLPNLYYRPCARADAVLARCPSLRGRFWPTPWCFNRHLQVALMALRDAREPPLRFDRHERLSLPDGGTVSLDWLGLERATASTPVLAVLPSLCGDGQSLRGFAREMRMRLGWTVVVLNRRGHGDVPLTTPCFNTLGSASDLREQLRHVRATLPFAALYAVGVSAGSGLLVRHLGEEGARTPVAAAVALCPGYDTTRAFDRVHRAYDRYMARLLREYFLDRHEAVLRPVAGYAETRASRSVAEFHARGFGLAGFSSAAEFHRSTNPMAVVAGIRVPLLVLNAADDPVCVVENVREHLDVVDALPETVVALTARGSHCAFLEGVRRPSSWAHRVIAEYLAAADAVLADPATQPAAAGA